MWTIPIQSLGWSKYILITLDDYSWLIWVSFLKEKIEAFKELKKKSTNKLKSFKNSSIDFIRSDVGREFDKKEFTEFCCNHGIVHNFFAPQTP